MFRVVHVITGLNRAGAEGVMFRLIRSTRDQIEHTVISLINEGGYAEELRKIGITVHQLGMQRGVPSFSGIARMFRVIKGKRPNVVQTWMYHGDLIGGVVSRLLGVKSIVWCVRHTNLESSLNSRSTKFALWVCAKLSSLIPKSIICCSEIAVAEHVKVGYDADRFRVIPNGYDTSAILPNPEVRIRIRSEFGLLESDLVFGCVARWDPQKDHVSLVKALGRLKGKLQFKCLLVGSGLDKNNKFLVNLIAELELENHVLLVGLRRDVYDVMNSFDLHILSSSGEGFPNAVAESMACGVPNVVTNVGEAGQIVGETGWIVPPKDSEALANGILQAAEKVSGKEWQEIRDRSRARVVDLYDLRQMVDRYLAEWQCHAE